MVFYKREDGKRYWCFKGQFKGKEPFIFGSIFLPLDATLEQILEEGNTKWHKIMPIEIPPSWTPVAGIIVFQKDD